MEFERINIEDVKPGMTIIEIVKDESIEKEVTQVILNLETTGLLMKCHPILHLSNGSPVDVVKKDNS